MTTTAKAQRIYQYMVFRAERSGQLHNLTIDYYRHQIASGIKRCFGVTVGLNGVESDAQQPGLLAEWQAKSGRSPKEFDSYERND
jgi:hypothetical protein